MFLVANSSSNRRLARFGVASLVWTLLGLFDAAHSYMKYMISDDPVTWPQVVAMGLLLWYAWAILSVFVFRFAQLYPLDPRSPLQFLIVHSVAAAFFACVKLAMDYPIIELCYCPD